MLRIKNTLGTWITIPTPSSYTVGVMDISDAKRNANGDMVREIINTKVKLSLTWNYLTRQDYKTILQLCQPSFFELEYTNPIEDDVIEGFFYAGDRTADALRFIDGVPEYVNVAINFIEG